MSWFGSLIETYDRVSDIAGIPDAEDNVLLPYGHKTLNTHICVTLDGSGIFRRAEMSPVTIVVPGSSRSNGIAPYPLHDNLEYLAMDEKKHKAYLEQLAAWSGCHPKVEAVRKYVEGGTLLNDLQEANVKTDDRLFVRFRVESDDTPELWQDTTVAKAWQDYCTSIQRENRTLCYATGVISQSTAKHPNGINSSTNGAKLISIPSNKNFITYQGRFTKPEQANAISADASHKAHAMLKYLIATQGHKCDTQAVVAWAIEDGQAQPDPFANSFGIYNKTIEESGQEKLTEAQAELNYAKELSAALRSRGNKDGLTNWNRRVAVMAVDAATTGRMGITFYQELGEDEYLDRIIDWHETCCWRFRRDKLDCVTAPSVNRIIAAVYGESKGEGYTKIQKQARERLLHMILCGEPLSRSWVSSAVTRVSNPFSYSKQDGGWDREKWLDAMGVVCAVARKFYYQKKEAFSLELETTRKERDYLFGRLLAIADRLESRARYEQMGKDDTDKRPTNAVRYMSAFVSKPMRTWALIFTQLNPYIRRLNGAEWYQRQIDEIMALFDPDEFNDKPLGGKYLLGYSLQRKALQAQNKKGEITNEPDQEN